VCGDHLGWALSYVQISPGLCVWDFTGNDPPISDLLLCRAAGMAGESIAFDGDARLHMDDWEWIHRVLQGEEPERTLMMIGQAIIDAEEILRDRWDAVAVLTDFLLSAERLSGSQARQLLLQARGRR